MDTFKHKVVVMNRCEFKTYEWDVSNGHYEIMRFLAIIRFFASLDINFLLSGFRAVCTTLHIAYQLKR